ncbi:MAG: nucleotide-binding protein [Candidatus Odinarchaeia archaeon]
MKTYIFLSSKGGVGKRQIVSNFILLLLELKKNILLIDLSNSLFNEILDLPKSNLTFVDNCSSFEEAELIIKKNSQIKYDYLILVGHTLPFNGFKADSLFIITTPFRISLIKSKELVRKIHKENFSGIWLIINKVGENSKYEYSNPFIEKVIGLPIIQDFPYDINVIKSEQLGLPLFSMKHEPKFMLALLKFFTKVCDHTVPNTVFHRLMKNSRVKKKHRLNFFR